MHLAKRRAVELVRRPIRPLTVGVAVRGMQALGAHAQLGSSGGGFVALEAACRSAGAGAVRGAGGRVRRVVARHRHVERWSA